MHHSSGSIDDSSRLKQFAWEQWDDQVIAVIFRPGTYGLARYVVKRYIEQILFQSERWKQLSSHFPSISPMVRAYPLTSYEVDLMRRVLDYHLNDRLHLRITQSSDQLIEYEGLLDFISRAQELYGKNANSYHNIHPINGKKPSIPSIPSISSSYTLPSPAKSIISPLPKSTTTKTSPVKSAPPPSTTVSPSLQSNNTQGSTTKTNPVKSAPLPQTTVSSSLQSNNIQGSTTKTNPVKSAPLPQTTVSSSLQSNNTQGSTTKTNPVKSTPPTTVSSSLQSNNIQGSTTKTSSVKFAPLPQTTVSSSLQSNNIQGSTTKTSPVKSVPPPQTTVSSSFQSNNTQGSTTKTNSVKSTPPPPPPTTVSSSLPSNNIQGSTTKTNLVKSTPPPPTTVSSSLQLNNTQGSTPVTNSHHTSQSSSRLASTIPVKSNLTSNQPSLPIRSELCPTLLHTAKIDGDGWVQINNVYLPFIIKNRQRLVPYQVLVSCKILEADELRSTLSLATLADTKLINSMIRNCKINSEEIPENTSLINVYHVLIGTKSLVYVKILPKDNPTSKINRQYKSVLALRGGSLYITTHLLPFVCSSKHSYIPLNDILNIYPNLHTQLKALARVPRTNELDYLQLVQIYYNEKELPLDTLVIDIEDLNQRQIIPSRNMQLTEYHLKEKQKLEQQITLLNNSSINKRKNHESHENKQTQQRLKLPTSSNQFRQPIPSFNHPPTGYFPAPQIETSYNGQNPWLSSNNGHRGRTRWQ